METFDRRIIAFQPILMAAPFAHAAERTDHLSLLVKIACLKFVGRRILVEYEKLRKVLTDSWKLLALALST